MKEQKVIFIIPGYRQLPTSLSYKNLAKALKQDGYTPVVIKIPWKNSTISQNSEFFLEKFEKNKAQKKYILGFSYGAMIAFIASTKVKSEGLILCSLSPYFREDVGRDNKKALSSLARLRYKDFSKLRYSALAKNVKSKQIIILYGTEEATSLIRRATQAFSKITKSKKYLIPILNTEHNIGDKRYLKTVALAARSLR